MNKFLSNTAWMFLEKATTIVGGIFISVYVARFLGPKDLGVINFYLSAVGLVIPLSQLGLPTLVFDKASKNTKLGIKIINSSYIVRNVIFFILSTIIVIYSYVYSESNSDFIIAVGMIASAYFSSNNIYRTFFDTSLKSKYNAVSSQIGLICSHLSRVLFVHMSLGVIYFTIPYIINSLVPYIIAKKKYVSMTKSIDTTKVSKKYKQSLYKSAIPLSLVAFSTIVYVKINQVMLGVYFSPYEVGLYSSAVLLAQGWSAINTILVTSLLTKVFRERSKLIKLNGFSFIFLITMAISFIFSTIIYFYGEDLINILFGPEFIVQRGTLFSLSCASFFSSWGLLANRIIINHGGYKYVFIKTIFLGLLGVSLSSILVQSLGIYGAALSTLIIEFMGATLFTYLFKKANILKLQLELLTSGVDYCIAACKSMR
ncbi:oligosaccharide flippase family protein [Vibrio breoganii]